MKVRICLILLERNDFILLCDNAACRSLLERNVVAANIRDTCNFGTRKNRVTLPDSNHSARYFITTRVPVPGVFCWWTCFQTRFVEKHRRNLLFELRPCFGSSQETDTQKLQLYTISIIIHPLIALHPLVNENISPHTYPPVYTQRLVVAIFFRENGTGMIVSCDACRITQEQPGRPHRARSADSERAQHGPQEIRLDIHGSVGDGI